jgi:hypothetical protein
LAVSGFQAGGYLYSSDGRLLRTWTSAELGIDTSCAGIEPEQSRCFYDEPAQRRAWYKQHRVLDEILPLPEGPGLLVRFIGQDGKPRWTLRQIRSDGIATYEVPLVGSGPFERLHGDVRQGKIVLLRTLDDVSNSEEQNQPNEILVAELTAGSVR